MGNGKSSPKHEPGKDTKGAAERSALTTHPHSVRSGGHNARLVYLKSRSPVPSTADVEVRLRRNGVKTAIPPLSCTRLVEQPSIMFWIPAGLPPGDIECEFMSVVDPQAVGFLHGTDRLSQTLAVRLYRGQHHSDTPVLAPPPTHSQVLASDAIEVSILEGDRESRPIPCFREPDGVVSWDAALKPGRYSYRLRLACGLDTRPTDGSRAAPLKKAAIIHTDLSRVFTLEVVGCPAGHISDCPLCLTVRVNVLVHADHYVCRACLENWARSCLQEGGPTRIPVPCPVCPLVGPVSAYRIAAADVAPLLADATLARRLELAEVLQAMGGAELVECPGCGGRCDLPPPGVVGGANGTTFVRCPSAACRRAFCVHCLQPPHARGMQCNQPISRATSEQQATARADAAFLDQMDREGNARCPCGSWVQKTGGCNHMKHNDCPSATARKLPERRCHFCYCCFAELRPDGRTELASGAAHFPRGVFQACGQPRPHTERPVVALLATAPAVVRRDDVATFVSGRAWIVAVIIAIVAVLVLRSLGSTGSVASHSMNA